MSDAGDSLRWIEQRKARRYPVDCPVLVRNNSGGLAEFRSQNISLYGMCFVGSKTESVPDDVDVTVKLPGHAELITTGRVVWCVKNEVYGVEFGPEATAEGSPLQAFIEAASAGT